MNAAWLLPGAERELHWWDASGLRSLAQMLQQVTGAWLAAWGAPAALQVQCRAAGAADLQGAPVRTFGTAAGGQGWLYEAEPGEGVCPLLFPAAREGGAMARQVAQRCSADGVQRLASALSLSVLGAGEPCGQVGAPLSGGVVAQWAAPLGWRLVLDAGASARWRGDRPKRQAGRAAPLARVTEALAGRPLPLAVELARCELSLAELQDLQPGDVLRLPHRLDAAARVRHADGAVLFAAHLGRSGGTKVVELATL